MTTADKIRPIVQDIYGRHYNDKLLEHVILRVADRIDAYPSEEDARYSYSRQDVVREVIWLNFSGGSTAEWAAERIEKVL